ncbi:MAG: UDP-N-acetylglucosamine 1-carboxyvinyltransferase [Actinobacteria bacterium]|nr:UDP-N-acetylglucosamine 1-carboxyvinyltransferase [Actinomycetota bacterium]
MTKFIIKGGNKLNGKVKISGAKNSALKIMAAAIMAGGRTILKNVPVIDDVLTMAEVLNQLGAEVDFDTSHNILEINPDNIKSFEAPYELVRKMRASILVAGPLLSRFGEVKVAIPGGCNIGSRQIDLHLKGFELMGAENVIEHGYVYSKAVSGAAKGAKRKLKGAEINLEFPSRGATENIMMAACLSSGKTIINNAAKEPEINDLANFLNKCGAKISGIGTDSIVIEGVDELAGCQYEIMSDSIEAGTFIIASALCGKKVEIAGAVWENMGIFCQKLKDIGVNIENKENSTIIIKKSKGILKPAYISTLPYPGFPTDLQPIATVLLCTIPGISIVTENVFENRFMYVDELNRMGANIKIDGHHAVITGVNKLSGAPVSATDLRAGAALILAGLIADGTTEVYEINHVLRGYENFDKKLRNLGADIIKVS